MKSSRLSPTLVRCAGLLLVAFASAAVAQQPAMSDTQMHAPHPGGHVTEATAAFQASDKEMMGKMGRAYTGDTDKDFVSHMIPHHEGAVSMAKIELQYGKDPELRKMAEAIIKAQDDEIAFMKQWQARHGVK